MRTILTPILRKELNEAEKTLVAYWQDRQKKNVSKPMIGDTEKSGKNDALHGKKEKPMSILARFSPTSMTADQYDKIVARLYKDGIHPADGLELEVCFGTGDQMKVSLLFDSIGAFEKFGERLQPVLQELGMDPGTPDIIEVHHVIRRGA